MRELVGFTLKNRVFFNLVFILLMVGGAFSVMEIPVERYPEIHFGQASIKTVYPGASARDMESLVTRKIEQALEGMDDIEFIRSVSARGTSSILVKFVDDTDYEALYNEVRFRVLGDLGELPDGVDPPEFEIVAVSTLIPVVSVHLLGERDNHALDLLAEELKVPLSKISGVRQVEIEGNFQREFHVTLDPRRMAALGVSFDAVADALQGANLSIPAGKTQDELGELAVVVDGRFRSREDVVSTIIRRDLDGSFVRVEDLVASARLDYRDPAVISSLDGEDTVTVKLLKSADGNALEIREQLDEVMAGFVDKLAHEQVRPVITQDSTIYIRDSLSTLGWNLLSGMLLVSLITWYFMGWRNAGLVTVGVPFSFLVTMVLMQLTGNSLNEITLFAFVLVSGIVVDDAIVVVENIYRHLQEGKEIAVAIIDGTGEVMVPVISSTVTTIAAFLPMLLMTGTTGEFFALIPQAISYALIASLIECLLILPIHYEDMGPRRQAGANEEQDNLIMRGLRAFTERTLRLTLRFRLSSLLLVGLTFVVAIVVLGLSVTGKMQLIPIKFFPDHYKLYYVFVEGPTDTSLEQVDQRTREVALFIAADGPGYSAAAVGYAGIYIKEDYEVEFSRNTGTLMVTLPAEQDQAFEDPVAFLDEMRRRLTERFGNDRFKITLRPEQDGPPSGKDVNIRVVGADNQMVERLAERMLQALRENAEFGPYLQDLDDDRGALSRVLSLTVDQARVKEYGLDNARVTSLAASVLDGRYLGKYRLDDDEIDLKLRLDTHHFDRPQQALDIPAAEDAAAPVRLGDLLRPGISLQPRELRRHNGNRAITVTGNITTGAPISSAGVVDWATRYYADIAIDYPGASVTFGGEHEATQRSFNSLLYAFGLAVLVIYLVLASQFQSYLQPMIIISAVVFAIIGVVLGKWATQSLFTINSFIAVVGVTGVVVNDSLVLVDFMNRAYAFGLNRSEAIRQGIEQRLRPIALTTFTTTLGLLPMAIGFPDYSIVWGPMASTFVAGLATATLLTLFIVPVEWHLLMGIKERSRRKRQAL